VAYSRKGTSSEISASRSATSGPEMSVYMVFAFDIVDLETFSPYGPETAPLVAKHQGEFLVVDFAARSIEGEVRQANVVIRFPFKDHAKAFCEDPEYAPLRTLRAKTTSHATAYLAKQYAHA
jgi:uncharacterized protein (DUF1330 family)